MFLMAKRNIQASGKSIVCYSSPRNFLTLLVKYNNITISPLSYSCGNQQMTTSEAGQHSWLSEFDNQAYQKSPEPSSTTTSSNSEDKSSHSLSLTSLSSPIHEAGSSKKPSSFDVQSATSSDR